MKKKLYIFLTLCLALMICAPMTEAQSKKKSQMKDFTVYGNVKSQKGVPLMGVEINIQDSFINATSDENGDFSITVPTIGSVIVFYTEYYKETYQTVTSDDYLQIVLEDAPIGQGARDMVNMPYWQTDKRSLTASLSTIDATTMRKAKVNSLGSALQGRVVGLLCRTLGGSPGFDESQYFIRGNRTLNHNGCSNAFTTYSSTSPLIIVDGFERSFSELDPNEIESFSIVRDAAGTSIYGDRAANGVILVNTRRGQINKRLIEFNYYEGLQYIDPYTLPHSVDAATYAEWFNEARINDGLDPVYSPRDIDLYRSQADPLGHPDVDWNKVVYKKVASQRRASLSMSGGNQIARYFVLFGYSWQANICNTGHNPAYHPKEGTTKYNMRSNLDVNLTKWLTFSATFSNRIQQMIQPHGVTTWLEPAQVPANAYPVFFMGIDPSLNKEVFMLGGKSLAYYKANAYGKLSYNGYTDDTYRHYQMTGKFKADFTEVGVPGLYAEVVGHMDGQNYYETYKNQTFAVWDYVQNGDGSYSYVSYNTPTSLSSGSNYNVQRYHGMEGRLGYDRKWADNGMRLLAFYTQQRTEQAANNRSDYRYQNFGLWANYSYKNRYFTDLTLSYAGNDRFYYTDSRRTLYPSLGLGWIVSDEPWMQGASSWLNFMKIRASSGLSGYTGYYFKDQNGVDERYPARERWFANASTKFGTAETTFKTVLEGRIPNKEIKIETAWMTNLALELEMFNHQLGLKFDGWREHRFNIYTASNDVYPQVYGADKEHMPIANEGIVNSWGIDAELSWGQTFGDFSYNILGQISWMDDKQIALGEPPKDYPNLVNTGQRVRQDYGWKFLGFFKDQEDVDSSPKQLFGTYGPGNFKYEDVNGDGVVDSNDTVPIGQPRDPRLSGNLCLNLAYKNFSLEVLFQGTSLMYSYLYFSLCRAFDGGYCPPQTWMAGRFHYDENGNSNYDTCTYPKFTLQGNDNDWRCSEFWEKDASYIRLKNVELAYQLPSKFLQKTTLDNARIYISAFNPWFWAKEAKKFYFDPEDWVCGYERYPRISSFNIGVDLTF